MAKGRFAFIPETTLHSPEYKTLCVHAKALYPYFVAKAAGSTEGFNFPYTEIKRVTGLRNDMIRKAILDLGYGGFLEYEIGGLERNSNVYYMTERYLRL